MKRRILLKTIAIFNSGLILSPVVKALSVKKLIKKLDFPLQRKDFSKKFKWGVGIAAFQNEGATSIEGRTPSIWDSFTKGKNNIRNNQNADTATNFYFNYREDISLLKKMNFDNFRFSLSWLRILPDGVGKLNQQGVDFYHRLIDTCLKNRIRPWVTLYHWDLPQILEDKGGGTNRDITSWFGEYVDKATTTFGDKVKDWIVLNEPMGFTGFGYMLGYHAPGKKGTRNFLPAAHHAALCQSLGGRIARENVKNANVGTTFSCSHVEPLNDEDLNVKAAEKLDAILNRFYLEPLLGKGYPFGSIPGLEKIQKPFHDGDEQALVFDFDFVGIQYYFRTVGKFSLFPPILFATEVPASKRNVSVNAMDLEVYPKGLYKVLTKFHGYKNLPPMIIAENGVCYPDELINNRVNDIERILYFKETIQYIHKAIREGIDVRGFFAWTLTDNFE